MISYLTEYGTFYVTDRPANNVTTTAAQSVHPVPAHMHKDGHVIRQLFCQWRSGPCHAKRAANVASVRHYCLPATGRLLCTKNI